MNTIRLPKDDETVEFSTSTIGRNINCADLAEIIDTFLNRGGLNANNAGKEVGLELRNTHRTLQRLAVAFSLGILDGISRQEYFDARNADAIKTAKKITEMRENGDLDIGAFI